MIVAVGSDDAQTIAEYQHDPDIALGIEGEAIDSCSCPQIAWSKYFFADQATIRLYAETEYMIHVGFYYVKILFRGIESNLVCLIETFCHDTWPLFVEQDDIAIGAWCRPSRPPVLLSRHDRNPEPIAAIEEDKVWRRDAYPIHLCQQVFDMSIGVEFLNFAQTEVGDNEGAIIGHRKTIWFIATQTSKKLL